MTDEANRPSPEDATVAFGAQQPKPAVEIPGYRIIRSLGEGGMGTVYLAEDEALGRRVAIKVISHGVAHDPAIRARFLREARLLATIEHPNVVRVYSFGASEERAYLVMSRQEVRPAFPGSVAALGTMTGSTTSRELPPGLA